MNNLKLDTGGGMTKNSMKIFMATALCLITAISFIACVGEDTVPANTAPVASAGPDRIVSIGSTVTLDGSASSDADEDTLTYSWTLTSTPAGSSATLSDSTVVNPTFTADESGSYTGSLVVNDGTYDSSADTVTITAVLLNMPVPDTGQTTSYTDTFGEDNDYITNPMSFADNGNGTVTDNVTGLMWQQQDDNTARTWSNAEIYCSGLSLGGYADWRLPAKRELWGILDYGTFVPSIDSVYFPNTNALDYWSFTTSALGISSAWRVNFRVGHISYIDKTESYHVRCVRGQEYAGNFTYCEGLSHAGHGDWRLPNAKELESITDETVCLPAIDTTYFLNTNISTDYWSSTTYANYSSYAWIVDFGGGGLASADKPLYRYVRCVR
jgi:hypothetical protein